MCLFQSRTGFPGRFAAVQQDLRGEEERFQSRTGFPGRFALVVSTALIRSGMGFNPERASQAVSPLIIGLILLGLGLFQSRTGFPGRFAQPSFLLYAHLFRFQSRTGFPGRFASISAKRKALRVLVSIPNGLPRPFRRAKLRIGQVSITTFQSRTGFPGRFALFTAWGAKLDEKRFNPERASQAVSPAIP